MSRYIEIPDDGLIKKMIFEDSYSVKVRWIDLSNYPAADVVPVVHAHWMVAKNALGREYTMCSNCRYVSNHLHNGSIERLDTRDWRCCPMCGADMRGDK